MLLEQEWLLEVGLVVVVVVAVEAEPGRPVEAAVAFLRLQQR